MHRNSIPIPPCALHQARLNGSCVGPPVLALHRGGCCLSPSWPSSVLVGSLNYPCKLQAFGGTVAEKRIEERRGVASIDIDSGLHSIAVAIEVKVE